MHPLKRFSALLSLTSLILPAVAHAQVTSFNTRIQEVEARFTVQVDRGRNGAVEVVNLKSAMPVGTAPNAVRLLDVGDNISVTFPEMYYGYYDIYVRARVGSQGQEANYAKGYRFTVNHAECPYAIQPGPVIWDQGNSNLGWGYFKITGVQMSGPTMFNIQALYSHCYVDSIVLSLSESVGEPWYPGPLPYPARVIPVAVEAEDAAAVAKDVGAVGPIAPVIWGSANPEWSLDANALALPDNGDEVAIALDVPANGNYQISARVRRGSNGNGASYGGGYRFRLNGSVQSYSLDPASTIWDRNYANIGWGSLTIPTQYLSKGLHTLFVGAQYHYAYIDQVRLVPQGVQPTPVPVVTPTPTPVPVVRPNPEIHVSPWETGWTYQAERGYVIVNDAGVQGNIGVRTTGSGVPANSPNAVILPDVGDSIAVSYVVPPGGLFRMFVTSTVAEDRSAPPFQTNLEITPAYNRFISSVTGLPDASDASIRWAISEMRPSFHWTGTHTVIFTAKVPNQYVDSLSLFTYPLPRELW